MFIFFGLLGPFTARYLSDIVSRLGSNVQLTVTAAVPADGVRQYLGNIMQLGLLTAIAAAAGAFAFDGESELAAFLRTRVRSMQVLVLARFAVWAPATAVVFALGTAAAWYETRVLIGSLGVEAMLFGTLYGALYFAFVISLVALAASIARGVLGTVVVTYALIAGVSLLGLVPTIGEWLPGRLANAMLGLLTDATPAQYVRSAIVGAVAASLALWVAGIRLSHREL
ncbi:MAG: hypothetical protein R3C39_11630 [Dehalococcoidia bacterium]